MASVDFSLTEKCVINPVLRMRAKPIGKLSLDKKVTHFLESEVLARVVAVATSFFAAIDCVVHLGTGIYKGVHFGLRKMGITVLAPAPSGREVKHHFKTSAKFFGVTLIGSIAAVIWPDVLKHFKVGPVSPGGTSDTDWKNTSDRVQNLWNQANNPRAFARAWEQTSLDDRHTFVILLEKDNTQKGLSAKAALVNIIYQKVTTQTASEWPSEQNRVFYHATSRTGLEGILKSRKIEVRHENMYRGAFVSTTPEAAFGDYILVFKRTIERMSTLNHGFRNRDAYWAGFSRDIPVNEMTLDRIIVARDVDLNAVRESAREWFGSEVTVSWLNNSDHSNRGDTEIPSEWPPEDPNSDKILVAIKARVKQMQHQPAMQRVRQRARAHAGMALA